MPDFIDHASTQETKFTEMAIAHQLKRHTQPVNQPSAKQCAECGDDIPEGRRVAIEGCRYCATCQAELE